MRIEELIAEVTTSQLTKIIDESGYEETEIMDVVFINRDKSTDNFVFGYSYWYEDEICNNGRIYVTLEEDGTLTADF